jgi:predicted transcriptional regulator
MALTIELSPELEQRLAALAARQGRPVGEVARQVLEDGLAGSAELLHREAAPAANPGLSPEELQSWLHEQGARPVRFEEIFGLGAEGEDDLDVDEFLAYRREAGEEDLRRMEARLREWDEAPQ